MKKYVSEFVKEQQRFNDRARYRGRLVWDSRGGNTFDPEKKLEKAWDEMEAGRAARNQ